MSTIPQLSWRAWNLVGLHLSQLRFNHQVYIDIKAADCELVLAFSQPFHLQIGSRVVQTLDPQRPETLSSILSILHRPLMRFMVSSQGHCKLLFADGTIIWADPHSGAAGWEATGAGSLTSASLAGAYSKQLQQSLQKRVADCAQT